MVEAIEIISINNIGRSESFWVGLFTKVNNRKYTKDE